jgi:alpha-L-arabinofuranosidase
MIMFPPAPKNSSLTSRKRWKKLNTSPATRHDQWGAQRAKDGHPRRSRCITSKIGNEDWFDRSGSYDGRFAQFYDAIKAKYPQLQIIATAPVKSRTADVIDEHYYKSEEDMESQSLCMTRAPRQKTKIFVGEWATRVGSPTPNMAGALGDAAWMCCLERNADIVLMHCYAPLFVNVSDLGHGRSMQWKSSDLIGYDALTSYGSPSYYAQKIFSLHQGDDVLATAAQTSDGLSMAAARQKKQRRGAARRPAKTLENHFSTPPRATAAAGPSFSKSSTARTRRRR